jgi:hypothetical protein
MTAQSTKVRKAMAFAELFPRLARRDHPVEWSWVSLLIAAGFLSSLTFECVTPFAAFAALTAATMRLSPALATTAAIWFTNQALGFLVLGYPIDVSTFAWGGAIGVAALFATVAAAAIIAIPHRAIWLLVLGGFGAAFVVYEMTLLLATLALGDAQNFRLAIIAQLAFSDAAWLIGVIILRQGLLSLGTIGHQGRPAVRT